MAQFGAGADLAAQCPPSVLPPTGWRPWVEGTDGPVPGDLAQRASALAGDSSAALGATVNYPLSGVTALIRVEAQAWNRDAQGNFVQGCYRVGALYLPDPDAVPVTPPSSTSSTDKLITTLTIVSLAVGTIATLASWLGSKR